MSWALNAGFGFGGCAVAAQIAGNVVELLEREASDTAKALDQSRVHGAAAAKGRLQAIVNGARTTAYNGGNISVHAEPIIQVWRDLSAQLNASPHLWNDAHALVVGFNLGGAYIRCERNYRHAATPSNLTGAREWLVKLKARMPHFTYDFESRLRNIEAIYAAGGLATAADYISALRAEIDQNLQLQ